MSFFTSSDTIIACSTGSVVNSAISVIRISGTDYLDEIDKFFSVDLLHLKPRYSTFCKFIFLNQVIDEVIVTYFKGPSSYNGEDIIELAVHGNLLNVSRIINIFISNTSVRDAGAGEFSFRALRNKKLTLTQVEGLDLLLNANSIFALDQGYSLMSGELQKGFQLLRAAFLEHKSTLELGFDFIDDIGEDTFNTKFKNSLFELRKISDSLASQVSNNSSNLISPDICLVGLPNAGKSSFFNNLLGQNRAIVSEVKGTTRDYIGERLNIDGVLYNLIDTAGIRETSDAIESSGIVLSLEKLETAFYKILLINPFSYEISFFEMVSDTTFDSIIFTHSDLDGFLEAKELFITKLRELGNALSFQFTSGPIEPINSGPIEPINSGPIEPINSGPIEPVNSGPTDKSIQKRATCISNINCLDDDKHLLFSLVSEKYSKLSESNPLVINRHSSLVVEISKSLNCYADLIENIDDISVISSELNIVGDCISELIGIISPQEVLHNIFDNFCIGK